MPGTRAGFLKMRNKMIARHGGIEGYKAWQRANASKGGKAKVQKGLALMSAEEKSRISRLGGTKSRRTKKPMTDGE